MVGAGRCRGQIMTESTTKITVTTDAEAVTVVNVFTVDPVRQDELVAALDAMCAIFVTVPGFVSANLHASLDGNRVVNYAQWTSEARFADALERADVHPLRAKVDAIVQKVDPTLVRVRSIHHSRLQ